MPKTPSTGRAATPEAEGRRVALISDSMRSNRNAQRFGWTLFRKHGAALDPAHLKIIRRSRALADAIVSDLGGAEACSAAQVEIARTAARLAALEEMIGLDIAAHGLFRDGEDGRVETAALRTLPKIMAEKRQALLALGLQRRAAPAKSLAERMRQIEAGTASEDAPIPAIVVEA
jgi:hypothetical protein